MEFLLSFHPIIALLLLTIIFIVTWGMIEYFSRKTKEATKEKEKSEEDFNNLIKDIAATRKELKEILMEYKEDKAKLSKLQSLAEEKASKSKPISKPKVSKYDKPNTLYIAYDFNIYGNQSYAKVRKHILDATSDAVRPAIKTTSIVFFNRFHLPAFKDIILVKKNGATISINKLYSNPECYIKESKLLGMVKIDKSVLFSPGNLNYLLSCIASNEIKFIKEEKEL